MSAWVRGNATITVTVTDTHVVAVDDAGRARENLRHRGDDAGALMRRIQGDLYDSGFRPAAV